MRTLPLLCCGLMATLLLPRAAAGGGNDPRFGRVPGWWVSGPGDDKEDFTMDYVGGLDGKVVHGGRASAFLRATKDHPARHAVIMQSLSARKWRGKRVRVAAWVRTENVGGGGAGIWLRAVKKGDNTIAFGRMDAPEVTGTNEWQRREIVADIPAETERVKLGFSLEGGGVAWFDDFQLEIVPQSVPLTDDAPDDPQNAGFEQPGATSDPHAPLPTVVDRLAPGAPNLAGGSQPAVPTDKLTIPVPVEIGAVEFEAGDAITITGILGDRGTFEPGGTYLVSGQYTLASREAARILLSITAVSRDSGTGPIPAERSGTARKGTSAFRFLLRWAIDGYPHATFYGDDGKGFGGVYFGHGKWLLAKRR